MTNLPELLAPAGQMDSLRAAIAAGADAVYFGARSFSNRARAKNFDDDELIEAIKFAHSCGVHCHVTVNTRVRDREMDDILRLCDKILGGEEKADALIVADFGVAAQILHRFPNAELHASTQTSLATLADMNELAKIGFKRLVFPRELTFNEIKLLAKNSPIETEIFIHGAHCVSLSGQCLMSYVMGGRSGNRGECAQPCRLPYSGLEKNGTLLSLADMCLAGRITDVISSGVASLKIEGRLKSASYVYGVTSIYRRLLDERRNARPDEIKELENIFTRGFTSGYFDKKYYTMAAREKSTAAENISETRAFKAEINKKIAEITALRKNSTDDKIPVIAKLTVSENIPSTLEFTAEYGNNSCISAVVEGEIPTEATGKPLDKVYACRSLSKLGDTKFYLDEADSECVVNGNLWLATSSLNNMRRRCATLLGEKMETAKNSNANSDKMSENVNTESCSDIVEHAVEGRTKPNKGNINPKYTALIADTEILLENDPEKVAETFKDLETVYIPISGYVEVAKKLGENGEIAPKFAAEFPAIMPNDGRINALVRSAADSGCVRFLVHSIGQCEAVRDVFSNNKYQESPIVDFSYRTNITNSTALSLYREYAPNRIYISPEMPSSVAAKYGESTFAYGRLPLMTLSDCLICRVKNGKCPNGNIGGRWEYKENDGFDKNESNPQKHHCTTYLTDRLGEKFFVISDSDCVNYIYNSVPIWMGDRLSELKNCSSLMFSFTDETLDEIEKIMEEYAKNIQRNGRRI